MADEIEKELEGVTDDDVNAPDDTHEPGEGPTDAELQVKLAEGMGVKPEAKPEEKPVEKAPDKPAEPVKEPDKPAVDVEAEIERRLQAKLAEKEAERAKAEQEKIDRAINQVIAKERKRDESAMRKLRDLQAATGMDPDKLLESHRARQIEALQTTQGLSEDAARELVLSREKAALYESREAERVREHEEQTKTTAYRQQKLDFVADPAQKPILKKALQKFGAEIDAFSDFGRGVDFMVALKYVAGDHLAEITEELENDAKANEAKLKADAEAREKAAEQRAIRNLQQHGKAAPETGTQGVPPKESLPGEVQRLAIAMGVSPEDVAKTRAARLKAQKR